MDSILLSIKKLLGIESDYTQFDQDIIMSINSVFMTLKQLGVGPSGGYKITDGTQVWSEFVGDKIDLEAVKIYIYQKVRLIFDLPSNAFVVDAIERQLKELEWRLMTESELSAETTTTTV